MTNNEYLNFILRKYNARDTTGYDQSIQQLLSTLITWASSYYEDIILSGSRAKGTAISIASDLDILVSLKSNCLENSGGLEKIYNSLYEKLSKNYQSVRKQNVSIRIHLDGLEVDITPARRQKGYTNYHWLFVSKFNSRKQTNIQKHINDVAESGRINEIKSLKIWRELNKLEFPSIYLEYLLINNILSGCSKDPNSLTNNFHHILTTLSRDIANPLFSRIKDPANSTNILSELLYNTEKNTIISKAKLAISQSSWDQIIY